MSFKKIFFLTFILFVFYSCSTVQVAYDYDKNIDFGKYKTYAFSEESLKLPVGQLNLDRLIKAVQNEMKQKGFTESKTPDVAIDLYLKTKQQVTATVTTTGVGVRGYAYRGGYGTTQVNYNEYTDGTLFIYMIDMTTKKVVWQGTGTKTLDETMSPDKREEAINYAVQQIMTNYPPKEQ